MTVGDGGAGARWQVQTCVDRGLRTRREPPLPTVGAWLENAEGLRARFSLRRDGRGRLMAVRFQCSACVTLIAYCQALAEHETGRPLAPSPVLEADQLALKVAGVPPFRQDRAALAVAAWRAALLQANTESA